MNRHAWRSGRQSPGSSLLAKTPGLDRQAYLLAQDLDKHHHARYAIYHLVNGFPIAGVVVTNDALDDRGVGSGHAAQARFG